jgi:cellulase/cellobiase CelA1
MVQCRCRGDPNACRGELPAPTASPPPVTTPPPATGACTAAFRVVNAWQAGFQGEFTVTAGSTAINGWTVRWTNGTSQVVSQLWNGVYSAAGAASTVKNATWNGALSAAGSTTFGFLATGPGAPSTNAVSCTSP